jgi:SurA N-terminal domain
VKRLAALAAVAAFTAGCTAADKREDRAVAHVGDHVITRAELAETVEHFREEAKREGRPFPEKDTAGFDDFEGQALALLVDHVGIEQAAVKQLGVRVSDEAVERRLEQSQPAEVEGEDEFARETVRSQLVLEGIYRVLARGTRVSDRDIAAYYRRHRDFFPHATLAQARDVIRRQLLGARRNAVVARWLKRTRRALQSRVRYEPGYGPSG